MPKEKPELGDAMRAKMRRKTPEKNPINGTKFTIAVSSAKGGVGKSTFATNLALALKKIGCKVGILDADVYGPSVPKMLGINEKPKSDGQKLEPIIKYELQCMSIGFLTDQQTPMIWRVSPVCTTHTRCTLAGSCRISSGCVCYISTSCYTAVARTVIRTTP